MERKIVHVDMDAFFAAVEQRDNPALRGRPVVVGGDPDRRGVVAAASYEARRYGIRSAMPCAEARRRCPGAIFLPVDGRKYAQVSRQVMAILADYTPLVEQLSVDEAFLDLTGSEKLFGPAAHIGAQIRQRVHAELGLTASVGVGPNKFIAKLASEHCKPDGLLAVTAEQVEGFLRDLPIRALWGVGAATAERLGRLGIATIGELAIRPREELERLLGEVGGLLHELAHGRDERPVQPAGQRKSCSAETTFARDVSDPQVLRRTLLGLAEQTGRRLRADGLRGRTVTLKLRYADFRTITRRHTLEHAVNEDRAIFDAAWALLSPQLLRGKQVRLIGVGVSQFEAGRQLTLFDPRVERRPGVDAALDAIRKRFGPRGIMRGTLVEDEEGQ